MALPNRELELWNKLVSLPLDRLAEEPAPEFGFTRRLMRDEKWDYATAIRVTAEYRRFLLLAYLGPVSPPVKVDAAWHLHLTYTRAYNVGLCERTLGRPLDHTPSGGTAETAHYASVYEDTLNRYRAVFGEEPPADLWPPTARANTTHTTRKKPWPTAARIAFASLAGLAIYLFMVRNPLIVLALLGLLLIASPILAATRGKRKSSDGGGCGSAGCGAGSDGGGGDGSGCGGGCGGGGCG